MHKNNDLLIGATLETRDGDQLSFTRRKRRSNSLRQEDGETPLHDSRLKEFLGTVDQTTFTHQFGINLARLQEGGTSIAEGEGELGSLLFAAGSGLTHLRQTEKQLENEARELFLPATQARNPFINQGLQKLRTAKEKMRSQCLTGSKWQEAQHNLENARQNVHEVTKLWKEKSEEQYRLERISNALPEFYRYRDEIAKDSMFQDVASLPEGFQQKRLKLVNELNVTDELGHPL